MIRLTLPLLFIVFMPHRAQAQLIGEPDTCHFEWNIDEVLRHQSDWYHTQFAGGALRVCVDAKGKFRDGEIFDAPRKTAGNICSIRSWMVPLKRSGQVHPTFEPSREPIYGNDGVIVRMQKTEKTCPRQDDRGYIRIDSVPNGIWLEMMRVWDGLRLSPQSLREVCVESVSRGAQDDLIAALSDSSQHLKVSGINAYTDVNLKGDPDQASGRLELHVTASDADWYTIGFDWVDGRLRVVRISHLEA